jgi:hypothetical protein
MPKWKTGLENPANVTAFGWKQMSGPKKRIAAAMNPEYMFTVIFGK